MKTRSLKRTDVLQILPGIAGTIAWRWQLLSSRLDNLPGDRGDPRQAVYLTEHWYQVFRGHAEVLSPAIFYPVKGTVGYSESMFLQSLPYSVMRAAGANMFAAIAAPLILIPFLNYLACLYLLRRVLRLHLVAAVFGATFFAFNSPIGNHPEHYGYQISFLLPLIAACAIRLGQLRASLTQLQAFGLMATGAICVALELAITPYLGWFVVFWSCLFLMTALAISASRRGILEIVQRLWRAIAGSLIVFALAMIPCFAIYLPVVSSTGPRSYLEAQQLTPDLWSVFQMGEGNHIWGWLSTAIGRVHPLASTELNIAIGIVPSVVMVALVVWSLRTSNRTTVGHGAFAAMVLATMLFCLIAIRYPNNVSPWRLVYDYLPAGDEMRAIARYMLVLVMPISIALAIVVDRSFAAIAIRQSATSRGGLTAALLTVATFGIVEQFGQTPYYSAAKEQARLSKLAASLPGDCKVFYAAPAPVSLPVKHEYQIDAMLVSSMRNIPTINGYGGKYPPDWDLRGVNAPDYMQRVSSWIASHHITGRVCRLEIAD